MLKSWKTTAAGAGVILASLAGVLHDISIGDYTKIPGYIAGIMAGIGLLHSKDNNVTGGTVSQ